MRTDVEQRPSLIPRLLAALAGFGARHPWLVLAVTAVTCAASLVYTSLYLTCETHRNDLIGKNKDPLGTRISSTLQRNTRTLRN